MHGSEFVAYVVQFLFLFLNDYSILAIFAKTFTIQIGLVTFLV